jgi:hypothetical protein
MCYQLVIICNKFSEMNSLLIGKPAYIPGQEAAHFPCSNLLLIGVGNRPPF